jgi:iron-sulfur cluster assembly protein
MAYVLEFADQLFEGDVEFIDKDVRLVVSQKDLTYLNGVQVDYQKKGLNEGFEFINPNESARCGCGESFTV